MHPLRLLFHFAISAAAVAITAWLLPGAHFTGLIPLLLATLVLGLINALVRPVIMLLTLPINAITLGIAGLVINALLVLGVAELVTGFTLDSFWWALAFSIVLTIVHGILHIFERKQ